MASDPQIGKLIVAVEGNTAKLQESMGQAQSVVEQATGKMGAAIASLGSKFTSGVAFGELLAKGIEVGIEKLTEFSERIGEFGKQTIEAAEQLDKMAQRTGVSSEALSAFGYAAKIGGATLQDAAEAFKQLAEKQVMAAEGSTRSLRGFAALGIGIKNTDGTLKSSQELMLEIADAFSKMDDGSAKAGIAMQLFGDAGVRLIPTLNKGRDGLEEMTRKAQDLGAVISTETSHRAAELVDNLTDMKTSVQGVANSIAAELLPALVDLSKDMAASAETRAEFVTFFKYLEVGTLHAIDAFERLGKRIGAIGAMVAASMQGDWDQVKWIWQNAPQDIEAGTARIQAAIDKVFHPSAAEPRPGDQSFVGPVAERGGGVVHTTPKNDKSPMVLPLMDLAKEEDDRVALLRHYDDIVSDMEAKSTGNRIAMVKAETKAKQDAVTKEHEAYLHAHIGEDMKDLDEERKYQTAMAAIAAEGAARLREEQQRPLEELGKALVGISDMLVGSFANALKTGQNAFQAFGQVIIQVLEQLIEKLAAAAVAALILSILLPGGSALFGVSADAAKGDAFGAYFTKIFHFADGDLVPGSGSGDRVPGMLEPGEFVVREKAVRSVGLPFLRNLNSVAGGPAPKHFSGGGPVGAGGGRPGPAMVINQHINAFAQPDIDRSVKLVENSEVMRSDNRQDQLLLQRFRGG